MKYEMIKGRGYSLSRRIKKVWCLIIMLMLRFSVPLEASGAQEWPFDQSYPHFFASWCVFHQNESPVASKENRGSSLGDQEVLLDVAVMPQHIREKLPKITKYFVSQARVLSAHEEYDGEAPVICLGIKAVVKTIDKKHGLLVKTEHHFSDIPGYTNDHAVVWRIMQGDNQWDVVHAYGCRQRFKPLDSKSGFDPLHMTLSGSFLLRNKTTVACFYVAFKPVQPTDPANAVIRIRPGKTPCDCAEKKACGCSYVIAKTIVHISSMLFNAEGITFKTTNPYLAFLFFRPDGHSRTNGFKNTQRFDTEFAATTITKMYDDSRVIYQVHLKK